jgi:very-short-patch-repair endonuclease
MLWQHLKAKQLGVQFRRQVVIKHRYIVDFLASSIALIVEVDGGYHSRQVRLDAKRQAWLERLGYTLVRIPHHLVIQHPHLAVSQIAATIVHANTRAAR